MEEVSIYVDNSRGELAFCVYCGGRDYGKGFCLFEGIPGALKENVSLLTLAFLPATFSAPRFESRFLPDVGGVYACNSELACLMIQGVMYDPNTKEFVNNRGTQNGNTA